MPLSHYTDYGENRYMTHQDPQYRSIDSPLKPTPPLALLRVACLGEAATLLALLMVAVPLKHLAGYTLAVSVMGPVHGFAFLAFGWVVVKTVGTGDITWHQAGKLVLAACIPFGGIYSCWALK